MNSIREILLKHGARAQNYDLFNFSKIVPATLTQSCYTETSQIAQNKSIDLNAENDFVELINNKKKEMEGVSSQQTSPASQKPVKKV